jgi:uncharacterized protein YukE
MPVEISLPEIPGDPAGMRALAGALQSDARAIEGVASGTGSAVGSMTFEGPAADRFRDAAQTTAKGLGDCAGRLQDTAKLLEAKATEVEQKQRDRLAKLQQLREDLAAQGVPAMVVP